MTTLTDIFFLLGYGPPEQFAFTKLIAYRGGFNQPDYYLSEEKDKESPHYKRRSTLAKENYPIWRHTKLNSYYANHRDRIISDTEAQELLKTELHPSLALSFVWFSNMMQIYFLRKEFESEGVGNEQSNINQARFEHKDEIELDILKKQQGTHHQLFQSAELLHFIEEHPWPKNKTFHHVILQSSIEKYLKERIDFLNPFEGNLYLFTGPRGAFNFEEITAIILAEWFNMPGKVKLICSFLQEHSVKEDLLQWHKNLSALKKALMKELDAKEWPKAPESFYYYPGHKKIYDAAAKEAKHEPLDCEGGPWPVAADIAYQLIKERFKNDLETFKKIHLVPIVAQGKEGRLTTTADLLETWLDQYGNTLASEGTPVLIIGCNTFHFIPFLKYLLSHNIPYQTAMCKSHLTHKLHQFNTKQESKGNEGSLLKGKQWYIAGPAARFFSSYLIFDSLAKSVFTARTNIEKITKYYQYVKEDIFQNQQSFVSDSILAERMVYYHVNREYLFLANAAIDLAFSFYFQGDLIKTAGLFNFSMNVLSKIEDHSIKNLIKMVYYSSLVNMQHFIRIISRKLDLAECSIDIDFLQTLDEQNRSHLDSIRQDIFREFSQISPDNREDIQAIYQSIFKKMQIFYLSIVDQAERLLGKKVDDIAHIYMGSYSKLQMTPFSDIESLIITQDHTYYRFAKYLTQLVLIKIFQLRETVLPALGISIIDKAGKHINLYDKIFDDYTLYGVSFDQNIPQACKTPLGKKNHLGVLYRLIGTPESLTAWFSSLQGYRLDIYLPQLIHLTRFAGGKRALYDQFITSLKEKSKIHFPSYSLALLKEDLKNCLASLDEFKSLTAVKHKKYFYKPINIFLDNLLTALAPTKNMDSYEKIDRLFYANLIDDPQRIQLIQIMNVVLYLRLHQHFKFKAQRIDIAPTDPLFSRLYQSQKVMKSLLIKTSDRLQENETHLLRKECQLWQNYHCRMFKLPAKKQFIQTAEMKWNIRAKL